MSSPAAVSVSDLTVAYGGKAAVQNVSFDVPRGDYLSIVGPNGSGKSSLVKALVGLIRPASGRVSVGIPRDRISYMPQASSIPDGMPASVEEVVLSGTQKSSGRFRLPLYSGSDRDMAREAMKSLGITGIAGKGIGEVSGGQLQRVLLARAICRGPDLMVLDEPCSGLDAETASDLYEFLAEFNSSGKTVIMVSHDPAAVRKYSRRVAVMDRGLGFLGEAAGWKGADKW